MLITTTPAVPWLPMPCPRGRTVLLLTRWGVLVKGQWYAEGQFIAWHPLLVIPDEIRELMTT
jgi:hypothetical protein